jgi:hypothetical protein
LKGTNFFLRNISNDRRSTGRYLNGEKHRRSVFSQWSIACLSSSISDERSFWFDSRLLDCLHSEEMFNKENFHDHCISLD